MVDHSLVVHAHIVAHAPGVAAVGVDGIEDCRVEAVGNGFLVEVVPLEDAVRRNLVVEDGRQSLHLQIFVVGDEAAAVAPSCCTYGEGHHVAAFELEGANLVVELSGGDGLHEAS